MRYGLGPRGGESMNANRSSRDHKDLRLRNRVLIICLVLIGLIQIYPERPPDREVLEPEVAPLNRKFVEYLGKEERGLRMNTLTQYGYSLGLIPSTLDWSHLSLTEEQELISIQGLPGFYDLRTRNKLPSIRDQGDCGSCWAFATMALIETCLMPDEVYDFSEQHMIKKHGFKNKACKGGNIQMATAYLARWDGPIAESDMPYVYAARLMEGKVKKHVQEVIFLPLNVKKIKKAVKNYGPVSISMCFEPTCFNVDYASFYNNFSEANPHGVVIVGWDDSFSRYKFNFVPPGNGAFIVRNSWGTDFGEQGYFYISYHDTYLGDIDGPAAIQTVESHSNYDKVYQYDTYGLTNTLGFQSRTAWMANIFTADSDEELEAVSFYALGTSTKYEIYVYKGVEASDPLGGTFASKKTGRFKYAGYVTVPLKTRVELNRGEYFSVVVKLTTKNYSYPIPIETHIKGLTKPARVKAQRGQSFISHDGILWSDILDYYKKTNVCLKAFVN
jgi:C1A family cysteine protease